MGMGIAAIFALGLAHAEIHQIQNQTIEVLPRSGNRVQVTRVIQRPDLSFEGHGIQEIWQAEGLRDGDTVHGEFVLKRADLLQRVGDQNRAAEQFQSPLRVPFTYDLRGTFVRSSAEDPLWRDQRQVLVSRGQSHPALGHLARPTLFARALRAHREHPFVQRYLQREEFRSENQYFIFDPTDFEFLRANPNTLRVVNKVVDLISLTEAALRRDAYALTLREKAEVFDQRLRHWHLNELGLISVALLHDGQPTGFAPNADGALYSGMAAVAQAMRWRVTGEPEALQNFKNILRGLILLLDVTGNDESFARTAALAAPAEDVRPPWRRGTGDLAHVKYLEGGNNDMLKGIFAAFAWAYETLPPDDPLLRQVSQRAVRLSRLRISRRLLRVGNDFISAGLAALATEQSSDLRAYARAYRMRLSPADTSGLNNGYYQDGIADWSGVNLTAVAQSTQLVLARRLAQRFPSVENDGIVRGLERTLVRTWRTYLNSRRGFLTIMAHAFAGPASPRGLPAWTEELQQAVWTLREVPCPTRPRDLSFDFSLRPEWSVSAWPMRPWKAWTESNPTESYFQGAYDHPAFETGGAATDSLWRDVFVFRGFSSRDSVHARAEYLYFYWMARWAGLLKEDA